MTIFARTDSAGNLYLPHGEIIEGYTDSIYFRGGDADIDITQVAPSITNTMTFETKIIRGVDDSSDAETILKKGTAGAYHYHIFLNADDKRLGFESGSKKVVSSITLEINKMYHLAVTSDQTTTRIYLDGVLRETLSVGLTSSGAQPIRIGTGFTGCMFDMRLWAAVRTVGQISANMVELTTDITGEYMHLKCDDRHSPTLTNYGTENTVSVVIDNVSRSYSSNAPFVVLPDGSIGIRGEIIETESSTAMAIAEDGNLNIAGTLREGARNAIALTPNIELWGGMNPLMYFSGDEWTVEAWVKLTDTGMRDRILMRGHAGIGLYLTTAEQNKLLMNLNGWGNDYYSYGEKNLLDGQWHHVAFAFRHSDITRNIYVDGVNVVTVAGPTASYVAYGDFSITVCSGMEGAVRDVRFWSTLRSAQEVQDNMTKRLTGAESDLISYWPCDESHGTMLNDLIGYSGSLYIPDSSSRIFE